MGFNFQLNAYGEVPNSAWQQYVVGLIGSELQGKVNNWKYIGSEPGKKPLKQLCDHSFNLFSLPKEYVIPEGYQIVISLLSDVYKTSTG